MLNFFQNVPNKTEIKTTRERQIDRRKKKKNGGDKTCFNFKVIMNNRILCITYFVFYNFFF